MTEQKKDNGGSNEKGLPFFGEDEIRDRIGYQEPQLIKLKLRSDDLPLRAGNGGLLEMRHNH